MCSSFEMNPKDWTNITSTNLWGFIMAKLTYMDKKEIIRLYDEERYGYSRMCRKRTFRKFTKIRTVFPTDEVYLNLCT